MINWDELESYSLRVVSILKRAAFLNNAIYEVIVPVTLYSGMINVYIES